MIRKIITDTFSTRLTALIEQSGRVNADIAHLVSMSPATISRYCNGIMTPKITTVRVLAEFFNVSDVWLMGYDVPMEREKATAATVPNGLQPLPKTKKIPLLGAIACGEPILATENISSYIECPDEIHADFSLRCKGDSMINARIFDGDIVYIREQPSVENGEIAAVLIDGAETECTLKRFYKDVDEIRLEAENPMYQKLVFRKEEMNHVRVIGKAIFFTSAVR